MHDENTDITLFHCVTLCECINSIDLFVTLLQVQSSDIAQYRGNNEIPMDYLAT